MFWAQYAIALGVLLIGVTADEKYITATKDGRILFYENGVVTESLPARQGTVGSMDYDPIGNILGYVDESHHRDDLYLTPLEDITNGTIRFFWPNMIHGYRTNGVALDTPRARFYYVLPESKVIYYISLKDEERYQFRAEDPFSNIFIEFKDVRRPHAIALDHCRGNVYWSNRHTAIPTIERADKDGRNKRVIVEADAHSLRIDQKTKRLFWMDATKRSIESSDLDGNNRRILTVPNLIKPQYLSVADNHIYYADFKGKKVWKIPVEFNESTVPEVYVTFDYSPANFIKLFTIDEQIDGVPECEDFKKSLEAHQSLDLHNLH